MSKEYVSPGVSYTEIEETTNTVPIEQTLVGIIGFTVKGPFTPKEIATVRELHDTYGYATLGQNAAGENVYSKAIVAAERILKYSKKIIFCRLPIDPVEEAKFTVTSSQMDFEVADSDCSIALVTLVQRELDGGEFVYDFKTIDVDGNTNIYVKDCSLLELEDAVAATGKFINVEVKSAGFPLPAPAEILTHSYEISEDASVEDDMSAISFEVYQPVEVTSENTTLTMAAGAPTYTGSSASIDMSVVQGDEVTTETIPFVIPTGGDCGVAEGKAIKFTVVDPDPTAEEEIDFSSVGSTPSPISGTGITLTEEPFVNIQNQFFDDSVTTNIYNSDDPLGTNVVSNITQINGWAIEVTQEKIDAGTTETLGEFTVNYGNFVCATPDPPELPIRFAFREKAASGSTPAQGAMAVIMVGDVFAPEGANTWNYYQYWNGTSNVFMTTVNNFFGTDFFTLPASKAEATENLLPTPGHAKYKIVTFKEYAGSEGGFYNKTYTYEIIGTLWDTAAPTVTIAAGKTKAELSAALLTDIQFKSIVEKEHFPIDKRTFQGGHLTKMKLKYNTSGTIDISTKGSTDTDYKTYATGIAKADLITFLTTKWSVLNAGTATQYSVCFKTATRNSSVDDRNFPIARTAVPQYSKVTLTKSGDNYNVTYYKRVGGSDVPEVAASSTTKANLITTCNTTITTVTAALVSPATATDRDFPIEQAPLVQYDKVVVSTDRGRYTVTASYNNGTPVVVARNIYKENLITKVNQSGILYFTKKSTASDRDFPIGQPAVLNMTELAISKNTGTPVTYKVEARIGINSSTPVLYTLLPSVAAENLITQLGSATVTLPTLGTVTPVKNIEKLTEGEDFPIVQYHKISTQSFTISANAIANLNELSASAKAKAFEYFSNTESMDVSILIAPYGNVIESCIMDTSRELVVKKKRIRDAYDDLNARLKAIADGRGECMVVFDYPDYFGYDDVKSYFTERDYVCNNACTCYPRVTYNNPYVGADMSLPASVIMATQMVYTDKARGCWFAPAGFGDNKGRILDAKSVEVQLTKEQRDEIYALRINPVMSFLDSRIALWGNKTFEYVDRYGQSTLYQQINVRRLANYIRKVVINVSMSLLFEPNDTLSWNQWKNKIRPILREIQNNRGCEAYKVVMDRTTISDEDIAAGRAPGAIYVMPTMAIEYIPISFVMTRNGAIFEGTEE